MGARLQLAVVVAVAACGWGAPAPAQVINGDFEQGGRAWRVVRVDSAECDGPRLLEGRNLPVPPGASVGRRHLAMLGDLAETPAGPCAPSILYQRFRCDIDSTWGYCTVNFDLVCWRCGGHEAVVVLRTSVETRAWRVPCGDEGAASRFTISARAGDRALLQFGLDPPPTAAAGADLATTLWVDNVESFCSNDGLVSAGLVPVDPAGLTIVDLVAADDSRHGLERGLAPRDCNDNNVPDAVEICARPNLDDDGDGRLDRCHDGRQINWVLLVMGLLVLIPTLMRMAARQRARRGF